MTRAIRKIDKAKVIEIINAHPIDEVSEFCELRTLLNYCVIKGMKDACILLLDYCSVSVEGKEAQHLQNEESINIMRASGYADDMITPLISAAYYGYYEICELLVNETPH